MKIKGRVVLLTDRKGELIEDIDTDQIYHNAYLHVTDLKEMGKYALGNLKGYEDYSSWAKEGDIIVAGHNFGAGSSRQHAVDCFKALRIGAIIAPSFGAIYKRNAINSALPIVECPSINDYVKEGKLKNDEVVILDIENGKLIKPTGEILECKKASRVQLEILKAGGLFLYGKKLKRGKIETAT